MITKTANELTKIAFVSGQRPDSYIMKTAPSTQQLQDFAYSNMEKSVEPETRLQDALSVGAGAGAATGVTGGLIYDRLRRPDPSTLKDMKLMKRLKSVLFRKAKRTIPIGLIGAGVGAGLGAYAKMKDDRDIARARMISRMATAEPVYQPMVSDIGAYEGGV